MNDTSQKRFHLMWFVRPSELVRPFPRAVVYDEPFPGRDATADC